MKKLKELEKREIQKWAARFLNKIEDVTQPSCFETPFGGIASDTPEESIGCIIALAIRACDVAGEITGNRRAITDSLCRKLVIKLLSAVQKQASSEALDK